MFVEAQSVGTRAIEGRVTRKRVELDPIVACADNLQFMQGIPGESLQLIVTSPPYNIGKRYEKKHALDDYLAQQEAVIDSCVRLLKPSGSICWQVGNHVQNGQIFPLDILLYPMFASRGLQLRNRIVWHFEHGLHSKRRLSGRYETLLWFTKSDGHVFNLDAVRVPPKYPQKKYYKGPKIGQLSCNPLGKNPGDLWIIPNVKHNHIEKTIHPCQFPVELVERLVLMLTNEGDIVFDPYMGVGSSVIAAAKNRRLGVGCDIEHSYVKIAQDRVRSLMSGTLRTRPIDRPVYDPLGPRKKGAARQRL